MTIAEIAAITTASVAGVGVILSVVKFWLARSDAQIQRIIATTRADVLKAIASNMEKCFAGLDKTTYVTLDYRMDGDTQCLRIPLAYNRVTECLQGMRLQLIEQSGKETVYSISTLGYHSPIRLHWHYHQEREIIQIIKGSVTDVLTGRKYLAGESWSIPAGIRHIADFDHCYAVVTITPPLPFASTHPIMLDGIANVYESPEPQPQAS